MIEINDRPQYFSKKNPIFKTLDDTDFKANIFKQVGKKKPDGKKSKDFHFSKDNKVNLKKFSKTKL